MLFCVIVFRVVTLTCFNNTHIQQSYIIVVNGYERNLFTQVAQISYSVMSTFGYISVNDC